MSNYWFQTRGSSSLAVNNASEWLQLTIIIIILLYLITIFPTLIYVNYDNLFFVSIVRLQYLYYESLVE